MTFDTGDTSDVTFVSFMAALLLFFGAWIGFTIAYPSPVQARLTPIPAQLDLGGIQWRVDLVAYPADSEGTLGYTRCDTHRIQLKQSLPDLRETLMHELLHAYVCGNGMEDFDVANEYYNSADANKHVGIDNIAYVITDALQRNPSLAAYLAGDGKQ